MASACQRVEKRLQASSLRLEPAVKSAYQAAESRLRNANTSLRHLSPYGVLERGYSITLDDEGRVVRGVDGLAKGMRLKTRLADGVAISVVEDVSKEGAA